MKNTCSHCHQDMLTKRLHVRVYTEKVIVFSAYDEIPDGGDEDYGFLTVDECLHCGKLRKTFIYDNNNILHIFKKNKQDILHIVNSHLLDD